MNEEAVPTRRKPRLSAVGSPFPPNAPCFLGPELPLRHSLRHVGRFLPSAGPAPATLAPAPAPTADPTPAARSSSPFPGRTRAPTLQYPRRTRPPTGSPEGTAPPAFGAEGVAMSLPLGTLRGWLPGCSPRRRTHHSCCSHSNRKLLLSFLDASEAPWFQTLRWLPAFRGPRPPVKGARSFDGFTPSSLPRITFPFSFSPPPSPARQMKRLLPPWWRRLHLSRRGLLPQVTTGLLVSAGTASFQNRGETRLSGGRTMNASKSGRQQMSPVLQWGETVDLSLVGAKLVSGDPSTCLLLRCTSHLLPCCVLGICGTHATADTSSSGDGVRFSDSCAHTHLRHGKVWANPGFLLCECGHAWKEHCPAVVPL